jgi:hypothetical protein
MDKELLFEDFILIKKMNVPNEIKVGMITQLFRADENRWRVIGITKDALLKFNDYEFKYISGLKINRAHLNNRNDIYKKMLTKEFNDFNDWWIFYYENDKTILVTSSENKKQFFSEIIKIDGKKNLFKSRGYSWTHNKAEIELLKELYKSTFS